MPTTSTPAPELAVFDLDGTITRSDTLGPYVLGFLLQRPWPTSVWRLLRLVRVLPTLMRYLVRLADEGQLKAAFIQATLGGSTRSDIEAWTASFVPRLRGRGLFAAALEQIARHRARGDHLVLMSASTDLYVPAIGRELGFAEVICTGVRWDGEHLNGELTTPNRRGAEKVRCFTALRERHHDLAAVAYGNAASDLPHLRLAERGILVNGSRSARRAAARNGITCVDWH
ncbi:MAG: family hydrolase [Gammaproteobacteria bacterium]|nr:family hydrolase [Gammaproteobacteria bacterium]